MIFSIKIYYNYASLKNTPEIIVIFGNFANDFCLATNFAAIARFSI